MYDLHANYIGGNMEKEGIRKFGHQLQADLVGFAAIDDYHSRRSPDPKNILPGVRSIVVLGFRELDGALESENTRTAMSCRMSTMSMTGSASYRMARFIEDSYKVKAASVLVSYPLDMSPETMGLVGDLSLRHAAVAAGLGVFGRHNLVINPRYGTRVVYTAVLTELPLASDPPVGEDLCDQCGLCVEACPQGALDEEERTDQMKCLKCSQPYGIGRFMGFMGKFIGATPEEQKALLRDPVLMKLYQAPVVGFDYHCFRCMAACPAGRA
jgi:epoxyqueuosine reductase